LVSSFAILDTQRFIVPFRLLKFFLILQIPPTRRKERGGLPHALIQFFIEILPRGEAINDVIIRACISSSISQFFFLKIAVWEPINDV
jgi:hypothetical protein